ncbi:MAG TPA: hypothetical protein VJZ68_06630 [Nitrososphaera sp.]|nr:hypothetical protein [Nitrososphaera sp.]
MLSSKLLLISAIAVAVVGSTLAVSSLYASASDKVERVVNGGRFLTGPSAGGFAAGILIMYLTTLLI